MTLDKVLRLICSIEKSDQYILPELQNIIAYEARDSTRKGHAELVVQVVSRLASIKTWVLRKNYCSTVLDTLVRCVGDAHQNFI